MAENDEGRSAPGGWILGARRERDMATVGISFLYAAGATLGLAVLLLPHPATLDASSCSRTPRTS